MKPTLAFTFLRILLLIHICHSQPTYHPHNKTSPLTFPTTSTPRKVHIITELDRNRRAISHRTGHWVLGGHTAIYIDGTPTSGPFRLEIGLHPIESYIYAGKRWAIRCTDFGVHNTGKPMRIHAPYPGEIQHIAPIGTTRMTNADLFDSQTGRGMVAAAWNVDPVYVMGMGVGSRPNTCYDFVRRVVRRMGLGLDDVTERFFGNSEEYYMAYSKRYEQRTQDVGSFVVKSPGWGERGEGVHTRVFDVDFVEDPEAPKLIFEEDGVGPVAGIIDAVALSKV